MELLLRMSYATRRYVQYITAWGYVGLLGCSLDSPLNPTVFLPTVVGDALWGNHGIRTRRFDSSPVRAHSGFGGLPGNTWEVLPSLAWQGHQKWCPPPPGQSDCMRLCSLLRLPGLRLRFRLPRESTSLIRSATSFWSILCSQKDATAFQDDTLRAIALSTAASARYTPISNIIISYRY
jgi:hypothetical protein